MDVQGPGPRQQRLCQGDVPGWAGTRGSDGHPWEERQPVWVLLWSGADQAHGAASQMLLLAVGTVSGSGPAA